MIKLDIFSGHAYVDTGNVKQSDNGDTFVRCGSTWFGEHGEVIQQRSDDLFNLNTGVSSKWGDPFQEKNNG